MADNDPFGREKGEDPLADMGWSAGETAAAETQPTEVAAPEQPDAAIRRQGRGLPRPPAGIPGRRGRSNAGCAFAVVTLGFIIAVFAVVVPNVLDAIDTAGETDEANPTAPAPSGPSEGEQSSGPPSGLERTSMLRRANLAPALRELQRITESDRVNLIRVDAQSVLVTVMLPGDRLRVARSTWNGDAEVVSTSPGGGQRSTFSWSRVDASAPSRVVRATTRGRSSRIDYLVFTEAAGLHWYAYLDAGDYFSAGPDGRGVRRVGG